MRLRSTLSCCLGLVALVVGTVAAAWLLLPGLVERPPGRETRADADLDERLVVAARSDDAGAIAGLVAAGAKVEGRSGRGWTPLLHAVHTRSAGSVEALLRAGASANGAGASGQRPLLMAAAQGDERMVGLLLQHGADPWLGGQGWSNALDAALTGTLDPDGFTIAACQTAVVKVLLAHSPALRAGPGSGRLGRLLIYLRGCDEIEALLEAPPSARSLTG